MPYHVVAYTANTNTQTNFDATPVADSQIPIQNGHYLPQVPLNFYGGLFYGANLTAIRLVTPRSRMVVPPPLYPIVGALLPPDRPHIFDRRTNPFLLNAVEEVSMQMNVGGTANAQNIAVCFWGTSLDPVPPGDIYALHGTSTTAAVSLTWTQLTVTWDQTIPAGTYAVVGTQHQSTNALAHRVHFLDQIWRPGFASLTALGNISEPSYYYGGWGKLGQFVTYAYPFIEVLVNGTDNAHDIVMNIVKVA
jgi:hypothetical protein